MKLFNENIALGKAILNKQKIVKGSPEYDDYLKIRELVGNSNGYVGILTKLRFIEMIEDMDEIESIYNVLKNSKLDVNKLHKLSYNEILDKFYMDLADAKNPDFELVHRDASYSYYIAHTYKGILQIGSPTWCLKTKSHWDDYKKKYDTQYVAISNKYLNHIISPDNNYLENYNSKHSWIRYGVSMSEKTYTMCNDDNQTYDWRRPQRYTSYGIYQTIFNIDRGIKKSFFKHLDGCELLEGEETKGSTYHKVIDKKRLLHKLSITESSDLYSPMMGEESTLFVITNKNYSAPVGIMVMNNFYPFMVSLCDDKDIKYAIISYNPTVKILNRQANESKALCWAGLRIKLGLTSLDDIDKHENLFFRNDKWAVFDTDNFWVVVNLQIDKPQLVQDSLVTSNMELTDPMFFYLKKWKYKSDGTKPSIPRTSPKALACSNMDIVKPIWDEIRKVQKGNRPPEPAKKSLMTKFKDFFGSGGGGH